MAKHELNIARMTDRMSPPGALAASCRGLDFQDLSRDPAFLATISMRTNLRRDPLSSPRDLALRIPA